VLAALLLLLLLLLLLPPLLLLLLLLSSPASLPAHAAVTSWRNALPAAGCDVLLASAQSQAPSPVVPPQAGSATAAAAPTQLLLATSVSDISAPQLLALHVASTVRGCTRAGTLQRALDAAASCTCFQRVTNTSSRITSRQRASCSEVVAATTAAARSTFGAPLPCLRPSLPLLLLAHNTAASSAAAADSRAHSLRLLLLPGRDSWCGGALLLSARWVPRSSAAAGTGAGSD
jgi:hypothetical protein